MAVSSKSRGLIFALIAMLLWAMGSLITKHALDVFPPLTLLAWELAASSAVLWTALILSRPKWLSWRTTLRLALPGLLQPGAAFGLSFLGLKWTTVSLETLIWATESILMLFFARAFLGERLAPYSVVLSLLTFGGIGLASYTPPFSHWVEASALGTSLILLAVLLACCYTILAQRDLKNENPLSLIAMHHLAGLLFVLCLLPFDIPPTHTANRGALDYAIAVVGGISLFALPFWLYLSAIRDLGSVPSSLLLPIVPLVTVILAAIFLGEKLSGLNLAGVVLSILSVGAISTLPRRKMN